MTTMRTRKSIVEITLEDLRKFPVWEFAIDEEDVPEQDETWIRPVKGKRVPKNAYSQNVHTEFTTALGRALEGFMDISTADGNIMVSPGAIVDPSGYFVLPTVSRKSAVANKYDWSIKDRERLLGGLRCSEDDVFPMMYRIKVLISGEKTLRQGRIEW